MTKREVEEYIMSQIFPNASHEVTAQNVRNAFAPIVERVWTFLEGEIGDLSQLQTADKQSVVNAINAVLGKMKTDIDKVNADIATLGSKVGGLEKNIEESEYTETGYIKTDGTIQVNQNYKHTNEIAVTEGTTITISGRTPSLGACLMAVYKADGTASFVLIPTKTSVEDNTYVVKYGDAYAKFSHNVNAPTPTVRLSGSGIVKEIQEIESKLNTKVDDAPSDNKIKGRRNKEWVDFVVEVDATLTKPNVAADSETVGEYVMDIEYSGTPSSSLITNVDLSDGTIVSSATLQRSIRYVLSEGRTFKVSGQLSNLDKPLYIGYCESLPSVGKQVLAIQEVKKSNFEIIVDVPASCYLCVFYHQAYATISLIAEYVKTPIKNRLGDAISATGMRQFDKGFLGFAYTTLFAMQNTYENLWMAKKCGMQGVKCDLRLTQDKKIVLNHDAGVTLDGNGRITRYDASNSTPIDQMTFDQYKALEYDKLYGYYYPKACSFEEYCIWAKNFDLTLLITVRETQTEETIQKMLEVLRKNNMESVCVLNSYPGDSQIVLLRKYSRKMPAHMVLNADQVLTNAMVDKAVIYGNTDVVLFENKRSDIPEASLNSILYAKSKGIGVGSIVQDRTDFNRLRNLYIISGQMYQDIFPHLEYKYYFKLALTNGEYVANSTAPDIYDFTIENDENHVRISKINYKGSNATFGDALPYIGIYTSYVDIIARDAKGASYTAYVENGKFTVDFPTSKPSQLSIIVRL